MDLTEDTYDIDHVPTPEIHFLRQDPGEQGKIFRPRLVISMTDAEFSVNAPVVPHKAVAEVSK